MNIDKILKKEYRNNTAQLCEVSSSSTRGFQHLKINEFPTLKKKEKSCDDHLKIYRKISCWIQYQFMIFVKSHCKLKIR